jgi:hypothetical protein
VRHYFIAAAMLAASSQASFSQVIDQVKFCAAHPDDAVCKPVKPSAATVPPPSKAVAKPGPVAPAAAPVAKPNPAPAPAAAQAPAANAAKTSPATAAAPTVLVGTTTVAKTTPATSAPAPKTAPAAAAPVQLASATKPVAAVAAKVIHLESNDWRFAYPAAALRMNINLANILRSPMIAEAIKNAPSAQQAQMNAGLKMIQGIEKVQLSIHQVPGQKDPDVLALVTGQLDPFLSQLMTQQGKDKSMVSRQIAPNVLLLGKPAHVEMASRRLLIPALPAGADSLSDNDIWISGDTAFMNSAGKGAPTPPGLDALKKFSLGLNLRDPLDLNINLLSNNEAGADKLISLYNLGMAASAAQTPAELAPLVDRIRVEKQGSEVKLRFSAPVAMLKTAFNGTALKNLGSAAGLPPAVTGLITGGTANPAAAPVVMASEVPQPAAAPAPKPRGKIMIYNLDDGPREVGAPRKN